MKCNACGKDLEPFIDSYGKKRCPICNDEYKVLGSCVKCGARFVSTPEDPPKPGLCNYCRIKDLEDALAKITAERDKLQRAFGFTYCAYCGKEFPLDAPLETKLIGQHVHECPKHPMRQIEKQRDFWMESHKSCFSALQKLYTVVHKNYDFYGDPDRVLLQVSRVLNDEVFDGDYLSTPSKIDLLVAALQAIKLVCLTAKKEDRALARIVRICIDAKITEKLDVLKRLAQDGPLNSF